MHLGRREYLLTPTHYILHYISSCLKRNSPWFKKHASKCIINLHGAYNQFKLNIHYTITDRLEDWQAGKTDIIKEELEKAFKEIEEALKMFNIRNVIGTVKHIQAKGLEGDGIFMCTLNKEIVKQLIVLGRIEGKISSRYK